MLYFICYSKLLFYYLGVCVNLHFTSFHIGAVVSSARHINYTQNTRHSKMCNAIHVSLLHVTAVGMRNFKSRSISRNFASYRVSLAQSHDCQNCSLTANKIHPNCIQLSFHSRAVDQWRTEGGGQIPPPRNSEVLTKLSQIPSSMEYTSITI
jgi:hypothetical protein